MTPEEFQAEAKRHGSLSQSIVLNAIQSESKPNVIRAVTREDTEKVYNSFAVKISDFLRSEVSLRYFGGFNDIQQRMFRAKFLESFASVDLTTAAIDTRSEYLSLVDRYGNLALERVTQGKVEQYKRIDDVIRFKGKRDEALKLGQSTVLDGLKNGKSVREIRIEYAKKLRSFSDDAKVLFRDRVGKSWTFERYADVVVNTIQGDSYRRGQARQFIDIGVDVVKISTNPGTKDACRNYEGKRVSLTGATKGLPLLEDYMSPSEHIFHPNCRHILIPE